MRILIVEDEAKTADYLRKGLSESGYLVEVARDGRDGQHLIQEFEFDLIILDVMLPGVDGWQLLQIVRRRGQTPVLFLTARDEVEYRVKGLELGADDYLIKPFSFVELLARVRTLLRRGPAREIEQFQVADLHMDVLRRRVVRQGESYRVVQNHLEEFVRQFKWALSSRQVFEWQKMTRPETLTDIQRAARFYYLQQNAPPRGVSTKLLPVKLQELSDPIISPHPSA